VCVISSLNSLLLNLLDSLNSSSLWCDLYLLGIDELSVGPTFELSQWINIFS